MVENKEAGITDTILYHATKFFIVRVSGPHGFRSHYCTNFDLRSRFEADRHVMSIEPITKETYIKSIRPNKDLIDKLLGDA